MNAIYMGNMASKLKRLFCGKIISLYSVATHAEVDELGSDGIGGVRKLKLSEMFLYYFCLSLQISIKRKKRAIDDVSNLFGGVCLGTKCEQKKLRDLVSQVTSEFADTVNSEFLSDFMSLGEDVRKAIGHHFATKELDIFNRQVSET